ncbi:MAG: lytic murein transglycosylase [Actinomycetes bacterium]
MLVALTGLPAGPALGETPDEARTTAQAAADEADALEARVDAALRAYDRSLSGLAQAVTARVSAEREAATADQLLTQRHDTATNQVRAVYMSGGAAGLYSSVLDADSATDLLRRAGYVQRMMATGREGVEDATRTTARTRADADALEAEIDTHVHTASEVEERRLALEAALVEQEALAERLAGRADTLEEARRAEALEEARRAAQRVRASREAATEIETEHVSTARATGVPADYFALYRSAAKTCPGLSWTVLGAIGQVESGHGQNTGTSYAGAQGPMQFMPATFAAYGVDGDGDGDAEINDPADSVYSAANYLCANGAGRGGDHLYRAVWHYNHADWYVQMVLRIASQLAAGGS